jgi:putative flavoprotein involved in K+ transport
LNKRKFHRQSSVLEIIAGRIKMLDNDSITEVDRVLSALNDALTSGDATGAADLFTDDSYLRDLVTFTWNIKTMEGKAAIADMLSAQLASVKPTG